MSDSFSAIVFDNVDDVKKGRLTELSLSDLPDEKVHIDVAYSTVNFKDGLAMSEHSPVPIVQKPPLVGGIDLAGTVTESSDLNWQAGDRVLVNGYGLSERHFGGYAQKARINPEFLVRVPEGISLEQAMAIGTAGYTSMLCVLAIEDHGVKPEDGKVLVTGASGGVGSVAVSLLSSLGYDVVASSGRISENGDFLKGLGAAELIERDELARDSKPVEAETWAAVVDCVGGKTLATAIAQAKYAGIVTMCGLTGGSELNTTVIPFILRGVQLAGIDSVMAPLALRQRAWNRLADVLDLGKLAEIYTVEPLAKVPELTDKILQGQVKGRVVIDVNA
ncbi:oxidoreductase [Gammaproteobacteria bacterium]|nr:oxidoreductase [Gammaproteobacteria bacterium]